MSWCRWWVWLVGPSISLLAELTHDLDQVVGVVGGPSISLLAELTHVLVQVVGVVGGALHLPAG
jgi:hypothetical protein